MAPREIRFGKKVFVLRLWPTIIASVMLVVLLGLGTWQIQRLQWKQELLKTVAERMHQAPVDATTITDPFQQEYRAISATGTAVALQELPVHAIGLSGTGGFNIFVPIKLPNGQFLLVNRGWVPADKHDAETRSDGVWLGNVSVKGFLRLPKRQWMQPKNYPDQNEWYGVDLAAMADHLNLPPFLPFVLEADATPNPGGYPIGGQTRTDISNNHLVYAFIWFSLALALVVVYGLSSRRKVDP